MPKEAIIETAKGKFRIKLFDDKAPKTVANFEKLANKGFYNGLTFHRVIPNFVLQGGCPKGDGTGGPGYQIDCELEGNPNKHVKGALSMAHAGQCKHDKKTGKKISGTCTNGSQFFIVRAPQAHLDGVHTVFGMVVEGLDLIDKIAQGDKMIKVTVSTAKPPTT